MTPTRRDYSFLYHIVMEWEEESGIGDLLKPSGWEARFPERVPRRQGYHPCTEFCCGDWKMKFLEQLVEDRVNGKQRRMR